MPDGNLSLALSVRDLAGNPAQAQHSFSKKNADPVIRFTNTPLATWSSASPSVSFNFGGTIVDPSIASGVGAVYRPGTDNTCGTADDVIWPRGSVGGNVTENTFDFLTSVRLNTMFSASYTAFNGVQTGGQATLARHCKVVRAADNAGDGWADPTRTRRCRSSRAR